MKIWTAEQQKWWYEEMGGRACRIQERERKKEARVSEEGKARKRARMEQWLSQ
jgi:hypothetical protein